MTELQRQILNIIQVRFPVERYPFAELARQLDSNEAEIIDQINQLKEVGVIRRMGAIFDAAHLGYMSTLVAVQVPQVALDAFVSDVNALPGVSHNYGRNHRYNVWFTLTMPSQESIDETIERLRRDHKLRAIYSLPAERLFKIKVNFSFADQGPQRGADTQAPNNRQIAKPCLSDLQIDLIRQLQQDLPVVAAPFEVVAGNINAEVDAVLQQISDWKSSGLIRRFGASIRHQQAGFKANGMVVFEVEAQSLDEAGAALAEYAQVSHCYQRPTAPDWPYNFFAMTHCQSDDQLQGLVSEMVGRIKPKQYDILLSTAEYKKTNVKYFVE